uniref:C2H2-type domain-containing protein n=1 Tax=Anopheles farauti TaxID=69004 RepID=A0A182QXA5_9DIPT
MLVSAVWEDNRCRKNRAASHHNVACVLEVKRCGDRSVGSCWGRPPKKLTPCVVSERWGSMEPVSLDRGAVAVIMSFKCPLCDMPIESQEKLKQHIKVTHSHYYYDTYLFPPEMLFPGATASSATANVEGVISNEPLSTQEVTIEQAEEECCTCCAYEESGGDCGFCDCEDDAHGGECDDCLVM